MIDQATWDRGVAVLRQGMSTSLHCSIASVNEDGSPHVTPIGSLQITGLGTGMYFDVFNETLACNVDRDPRVSILVVDSSRSFGSRCSHEAASETIRVFGLSAPLLRGASPLHVSRHDFDNV